MPSPLAFLRRGTVPMRRSLLRSLLVLILLLSGAILFVMGVGARDTVQEVVRGFTRTLADRTETRLHRLFDPITDQLAVVGRWAKNGTIRCRGATCLEPVVVPVLEGLPQVAGFLTGDAEGGGVSFLREGEGWLVREVDPTTWGRRARFHRLGAGAAAEPWFEDSDFDPRTRPWYRTAGAARVRWTEPYVFFTSKRPGLTASLTVNGPDGATFVVAFDVLLGDLSTFTTTLDVSAGGFAIVATEPEHRVVGLPRADRFADPGAREAAILTPLEDLRLPTAARLLRDGVGRGGAPFAFESEGATWWGECRALALDEDTRFDVGIAAPLEDFLGPARKNRLVVLGLGVLALGFAAGLALALARRYGRPLEDLAEQSDRIRRLDTAPHPHPPSRIREVQGLYDAQERMRQALDSFARYVPTDVVRDLLDRGEAARIGGRTVEATVLFTDVRGFTGIAEQMTPADLVSHMSEYFGAMIDTLRDEGATIDKLVGDAIVAFWGAPRPEPAHAARATSAVLACRARLDRLNADFEAAGRPPLPTRFGLATGPVVVGNVGSPSRLHYTALGDTMNLASRLEGANGHFGTTVLAPTATVEAAGPDFLWRRIDHVAVKGRHGAVHVHELLGRVGAVDAATLDAARTFERALDLLQAGRPAEALEVARTLPGDEAARTLALRCEEALAAPPSGAAAPTRLEHKKESET